MLDIINIALDREMIIQDEPSKYINSNDEIIVTYVEKYCYNVVSHCLQLSKKIKMEIVIFVLIVLMMII